MMKECEKEKAWAELETAHGAAAAAVVASWSPTALAAMIRLGAGQSHGMTAADPSKVSPISAAKMIFSAVEDGDVQADCPEAQAARSLLEAVRADPAVRVTREAYRHAEAEYQAALRDPSTPEGAKMAANAAKLRAAQAAADAREDVGGPYAKNVDD